MAQPTGCSNTRRLLLGIARIGAGAGLGILDPIAALVISGIAVKDCLGLWRGDSDDCCAPLGFDAGGEGCSDECCE